MKKITILFYLFCFIPLMGIAQIDNDDCDSAIALVCDTTVTGSTVSATDSGSNAAPDVFYTYTGSGINENVTLSLCDGGTDYDSFLRVFDDDCNLVNQIAGNDDSCGLQSELTFLSDGVTTYTIMVEGFGTNSGNFSLAVTCEELASCLPPDNLVADNFAAGSVDISWDVINNAVGYNWEIQDVGVPQGDPGAIASGNTAATAATATGAFIDGNSYTLFVQADCDEGDLSEFVSIDFVFALPPENNDCEDAIALVCDTTVTGATTQATDSGSNAAPDVFYTYTGSGINENVTLSLCDGGTDYDSFLRVFDDDCNLVNQIAGNDDSCGLQSELTFLSDGVTTYTIMVEGFGANSGNFSLAVTCEEIIPCFPPTNLAVTNLTVDGTVDISWDASQDNVSYNWEIQLQGVPPGDPGALAIGIGTTNTFDTVTGFFEENVTYTLYVQSVCESGDISNFVSIDFIFDVLNTADNTIDGFEFFPNPVQNDLNISAFAELQQITVYNMAGQIVMDRQIGALNTRIDVSNLKTGIYLSQVISIDGQTETFRIIKK